MRTPRWWQVREYQKKPTGRERRGGAGEDGRFRIKGAERMKPGVNVLPRRPNINTVSGPPLLDH